MRSRRIVLLAAALSLLLTHGCDRDLRLVTLQKYDAIPKTPYSTYLYMSGQGGKWKAAFLKSPDSPVEIVPYAHEIVTAVGTFDEAMFFMKQTIDYKSIDVQAVEYKGKVVGYLLTHSMRETTKNLLVVDVYDYQGRVYFKVTELVESDS